MFRHADVVSLCLVCFLWQFVNAGQDGRDIILRRSHECIVDIHECLLLFVP